MFEFKPDEWLSSTRGKRLSTCMGKYSEEPYNLTLNDLYKHFFKLCPHRVILNRTPLADLFKHYTLNNFGNPQFDRRAWLDANSKGYWYELSERELDKRKTKNFRKVFIFEYEQDALHFKMVWG